MSRTVVIAQARMSSTRLPGKVLMDLGGAPVLDHVVRRVRAATRVDEVVLATSVDASDDPLAARAAELGIGCVRGSLDDVLSRFAEAARVSEADVIVRVTCDCPLIDPDVIDATIDAFAAEPPVDYCSNAFPRSYPIGMDNEVFARSALDEADREATSPLEREHVTPFIHRNPERFRLRNLTAPDWAVWPDLRLTLDEPADLDVLRAVVAAVGPDASLAEILRWLRANPEAAEANAHVRHRHIERLLEQEGASEADEGQPA